MTEQPIRALITYRPEVVAHLSDQYFGRVIVRRPMFLSTICLLLVVMAAFLFLWAAAVGLAFWSKDQAWVTAHRSPSISAALRTHPVRLGNIMCRAIRRSE